MGKKLITVLLAACMVFSLSACKQETPSTAPETTAPVTEAPTTSVPASEGTDQGWVPTAEDISYMTNDNGYLTGVTASDYIDLPDFSEVSFDLSKYTPTDEEVQAEIDSFVTACSEENKDITYVIKKGDVLVVDYVGKFNGEAFQGGTAENVQIEAGGVGYIDDFQDQLIGHHVGETFDIEVTFPVPYPNNPDYAGKDAVFTITVHSALVVPEFNDEFVQSHDLEIASYFGTADVKTAEEMRNYVKESIIDYNLNSAIQEYAYGLTLKEYPETLLQIGRKMIDVAFYMSYRIDVESVYEQLNYTEEDMTEFARSEITPAVFYQAIAEKEGWEIGEKDLSEVTGLEDNAELIAAYGQGYIARKVIEKRGVEYLKEHCKIQ